MYQSEPRVSLGSLGQLASAQGMKTGLVFGVRIRHASLYFASRSSRTECSVLGLVQPVHALPRTFCCASLQEPMSRNGCSTRQR